MIPECSWPESGSCFAVQVLEYKPEMLHSLLYEEHVLIDGYDKEMNIYMVEDYPLFSKIREAHAQRTKYVLAYRGQLETRFIGRYKKTYKRERNHGNKGYFNRSEQEQQVGAQKIIKRRARLPL